MRTLFLAIAVVAIAACSSSTEAGRAGDPSLLITNNLDSSYVYVTWQDGQTTFGRDSVPPRTANRCIRFLAQPDSALWTVNAHDNNVSSSQGGVFFNPSDRPAWSVVVSSGGTGSPIIIVNDISTPC